MLQLLGNQIGI